MVQDLAKKQSDDSDGVRAALRLRDRALEAFTQGVTITDMSLPDNPIVYANMGFQRLTGYSAADVIGSNCRFLQGPDTNRDAVGEIRLAIREGRACIVELLNYRKDRTQFWNALSLAPVRDDSGAVTHFVGVQTDVTPLKRLEEQYRQAQKMEAIGHLAGGVAHDFNNLLTIIGGYGELLLGALPTGDHSRPLVEEIVKAGERAGALTRQLLAFGRKQMLQPRLLDLNDLVANIQKMLGRLIGEDVRLATVLAPSLRTVKVDPGQMEQILLNLAVNSRDAMPRGGNLTIETANADFDESIRRAHPEMRPGHYVVLAVSDNGCGMDAATLARIFEPFFTTKEPGKGTGLGLATVYGIVKQSDGFIYVYSEPGRGTTFKIYVPASANGLVAAQANRNRLPPRGGKETVLLVEDEPGVRSLARYALQSGGYNVVEASDGEAALSIIEKYEGPIQLLLTDVVMPGLSGREVAERLVPRYPGLRVVFMSGYTDDAVVRHGVLEAENEFLQKPYTVDALLRKVRTVLDKANGGGRS